MGASLGDMLAERPVDGEAVRAHRERMLEEVRAYRLREFRQAAGPADTEYGMGVSVRRPR
ncbi:hypothetical protein [Nocardiopsis sp. LOL_012]|uniref:hypothetical protein n=1 Tax=Nocardiopsis sp. LOL_012 TaxID=3345409 RepID=UPI003A89D407